MADEIPAKNRGAIGERVHAEIKGLGLTQNVLADMVGCSQPAIVNMEKGGSFQRRLLRDVASALGVSENWLLTGRGAKAATEKSGAILAPAPRDLRAVPVVSYTTAGMANDYEDMANFLDEKIETDCRDPNCFALIVEGDSMEPVIRAGDRVIVMPNSETQTGDIVVARRKDTHEVFVKLVHFSDGGKRVKFTSYNPAYPPLEFSRRDFRFIYPVHSMKRMFRRGENGHAAKR